MDFRKSVGSFLRSTNFIKFVPTPDSELKPFIDSLKPVATNFSLQRVGAEFDGGYLLPSDLKGISAIFSPGVDAVSSFEEYFADQGIPCYMIDASIDSPPKFHKHFFFKKIFLGPKNTKKFITLKSWVNQSVPLGNDSILQMDIEGAEWDVLRHVQRKVLKKFRIMIIEFHDFNQVLSDFRTFKITKSIFEKLLKDFVIVHFHSNNCCDSILVAGIEIPKVVEITFLHKSRIFETHGPSVLPHVLDRPNLPEKEDVSQTKMWEHTSS